MRSGTAKFLRWYASARHQARDRYLNNAFDPIASTPEAFSAQIKADYARWAKCSRTPILSNNPRRTQKHDPHHQNWSHNQHREPQDVKPQHSLIKHQYLEADFTQTQCSWSLRHLKSMDDNFCPCSRWTDCGLKSRVAREVVDRLTQSKKKEKEM